MTLKIDTLRLDQLASDPASPIDGSIWYNVTDDKLRCRINGATVDLTTGLFDAIVAPSGGDYTTVGAAFAAGHSTVAVLPGTYNETADINIPDGGQLVGFGKAIIDFGTNSAGLTADAGGTTQTAGTVAVTNNSTAVVGTGTSWVTNGLVAGDWIAIDGIWFEISSVTNNTNLVLVKQWENTTQSGLDYVARPILLNLRIQNVTVQNIGTVSNTGLYIRGGIDARIIDVMIRRPVNDVGLMTGVQLVSGSYYMRGCDIRDQSLDGISLNTVRGCTIIDTVVSNGVTSADCVTMIDSRCVTITGGRLEGGGAAISAGGVGNNRNRIDTLMLNNNIGLDIGGNENVITGVMRSFNSAGNDISVSGNDNVIAIDHTGTKTDTGTGNKFGVDALGVPAQGDVIYHDGTAWARLAPGTSGNVLQTQGAGANPLWAAPGSGSDGAAIHDNVAGEIVLITEKVAPVSADLIVIEDSAAANAKKRIQIGNLPGGGGSVFGTEFNNAYLASSSGTNTTPSVILSLNPASLPSGTYRLGWSCSMLTSNKEVLVQIDQDSGTILGIGGTKLKTAGTRQFQSGFAIVTLNGVHTFDMEFWVDLSGDTWNAWDMRLELWRIS